MKSFARISFFLLPVALLLFSCSTTDLYERTATIPGHAWKNSYQPSFSFTIKDTTSAYQLFLIVRHSDQYGFNNIFVNLHTRQPGSDSTQTGRYDLRLATDNEGWLASGMDDIYEHRIPLTPTGGKFLFRKAGNYVFSVEQIMREDPLEHVYDVGLRIEKIK